MPPRPRPDPGLPIGGWRRLVVAAVGLLAVGLLGAAVTPVAGEEQVLERVAAIRTPASVTAARLVTELGDLWLVGLVGIAIAVAVHRSPAGRHVQVLLLLTIGGSAVLVTGLKLLVARPRPPGALIETVTSAYPSGHAVRAAAVHGLLLWWLSRRVRHPLWRLAAVGLVAVIALGVASSRVWLGVHLPSEVAAGVVLGTGWLLAVGRTVGLPGPPVVPPDGQRRPDGR